MRCLAADCLSTERIMPADPLPLPAGRNATGPLLVFYLFSAATT